MNSAEFDKLLLENVLLIKFLKKDGTPREMLCTKSALLLTSPEGINKLGYKAPKSTPKYDTKAHNNSIVWDIEKKDYRTVSCDNVIVLETYQDIQYLTKLKLEQA